MGANVEVGNKPLLLFDGVCNLCNGAVNFILDKDEHKSMVFASLQSALGQKILKQHQLPENDFKSMILLKGDKIFLKSNAVLEVVKYLPRGWKLLYVFKIIPRFIRDWIYKIISLNRYKWFGKKDQCRLPTSDIANRFISK